MSALLITALGAAATLTITQVAAESNEFVFTSVSPLIPNGVEEGRN